MDRPVRATVFGLDVWSADPLPYLVGTRAPETGRPLEVSVDRDGSQIPPWPGDARLISEQLNEDGTAAISIETHPELGYLLSGPLYGQHLISGDGRSVTCDPMNADRADWQRFLIGQVLPFAAALNGLEVLHASGVTFGDRALALLGPSGAGKTSLAVALGRLGANFLADDVLAVQRVKDLLVAHPGTSLAGLPGVERSRLPCSWGSGEVMAVNERERLVRIEGGAGPAQLVAMLFLERSSDGPAEPRFECLQDARPLLSSTFNFVLDDRGRLERLLDVCALAASRSIRRVDCGRGIDPETLAGAVGEWFHRLP
jgi:hypothetical protein